MGSPEERQRALRKEGDIYIVTRDNVAWLVDTLGASWDFNTIIVDELSSFKSNKSVRFKKLRKARAKSHPDNRLDRNTRTKRL